MTTALIPGPTDESRAKSHLRIPAVRVPTEPTTAEVVKCEEQLELTWRRVHAAQIALAELAEAREVANTNTVAPPRRRRRSA